MSCRQRLHFGVEQMGASDIGLPLLVSRPKFAQRRRTRMLIRTRMFFRNWLSRARRPSSWSGAKRRRNRREAWFVQQAICSGLGVEALESRQLLSATVLGPSAQPPPSLVGGQLNNSIQPAVATGVTTAVPALAGSQANSPPSAGAPLTGSLNENTSLSFSTANGNVISITDAAAGTNADSLTLSVSQGTLTLASTSGLSFTAGANGSSSFTVSGTMADLDSALDGLVYQPTTLYFGADSLAASVSNPTNSLSASTSVAITVAPLNAPAISVPGSGSLDQNGSLTFSNATSNAISITDDAAASNLDSLTLVASQGTLTLVSSNGLSFTSGSNGSSSFTVSGTVSDLNAALDGLVYQPTSAYSGSDSLSVSVTNPTDTLAASSSVALTVNALSEPATSVAESPASTGPSSTENGSLDPSSSNGSSLAFTDSAAGADSLSPSLSQGTMGLGASTGLSLTAGANGSSTVTASSPVASVNSALNAATYPADALSSSTSASLTANSLATPAITSSLVFSTGNSSAVSVIDAAAGSNSDSLAQSVSHGKLTQSPTTGLSLTAGTNVSPSFTTTSTTANLNTALNGPTSKVRVTHVGSESLSVSDPDRGDSPSATPTVAVTVTTLSTPPIVAPPASTLGQNGSLVFSPNSGNATRAKGASTGSGANPLTLTVMPGTLALASPTGLSVTTGANGSASFPVSGSADNLNAALNGLTETSTHVVSDSLSLSDSDRGDSLSAATTVVFTVSALSAPALVAPPSATLDQNGSIAFSPSYGNGISIFSFKRAAGNGSNSLTLSVAHGTITLASTAGLSFTRGMNGSASFTVTGTAANLNAALSGLVYTPTRTFSGSDLLALKVSDLNGQSSSTKVALRINVIGPTLTAPATGTVPQNGTLTFSKRAIQIADVNASTDIEQVVLRAGRGSLRLGSTNGITFVSGMNNSASMTISGTLTDLNAGLNGLKFMPASGFSGPGTVSINYNAAKSGLSVSTNVAVTVGTVHASFGPRIRAGSPDATRISDPSQPTLSTVGGTDTSPSLSVNPSPDDLARWDTFMAAMGLSDHS